VTFPELPKWFKPSSG